MKKVKKVKKKVSPLTFTRRPDGTRVFRLGGGVEEHKHAPLKKREENKDADQIDRDGTPDGDPG